jgi:hypothetical protein
MLEETDVVSLTPELRDLLGEGDGCGVGQLHAPVDERARVVRVQILVVLENT